MNIKNEGGTTASLLHDDSTLDRSSCYMRFAISDSDMSGTVGCTESVNNIRSPWRCSNGQLDSASSGTNNSVDLRFIAMLLRQEGSEKEEFNADQPRISILISRHDPTVSESVNFTDCTPNAKLRLS